MILHLPSHICRTVNAIPHCRFLKCLCKTTPLRKSNGKTAILLHKLHYILQYFPPKSHVACWKFLLSWSFQHMTWFSHISCDILTWKYLRYLWRIFNNEKFKKNISFTHCNYLSDGKRTLTICKVLPIWLWYFYSFLFWPWAYGIIVL